MFKKNMPHLIFVFLCLVLIAGLPAKSQATPGDEATATLKVTINKVINLLKEPAFTDPATRSDQIKTINTEILKVFDFHEFSIRTIGRRWIKFTEQQKKDFITAFDHLLIATYLEKLETYDGHSVTYTNTRTSQDGKKVEVHTYVIANGKKIPVFYQMLLKNNTWVVYDVRIEGLSLVENYRSQFSEIFQSGANIEELITRVQKLATDMQSKNHNVK